jgi:outer membrane biosynthesis protein TonB
MGEITEGTYKKARIIGVLGTGGTGVILFLILFFNYLITPIPPYPEGGGGQGMDIEVNLGFAEKGFGEIQQPQIAMPDFSNRMEKSTGATLKQPEEVIAQDEEETTVITNPPEPQKKSTTQDVKPQTGKSVPDKLTPPAEKPRTINKAALYKPKSKTSGATSQGVTKGESDQGSLNGLKGSATYGPGGNGGEGSGSGSGGGSGSGTGTGIGDGIGPGISFNLLGRSMILIGKPDFNIQKEGIVVVEITVDKTGKVIMANPGIKGSTIVDNILYAAAKKAALQSKFNLKSDAPDYQVGKITYHFKLK